MNQIKNSKVMYKLMNMLIKMELKSEHPIIIIIFFFINFILYKKEWIN